MITKLFILIFNDVWSTHYSVLNILYFIIWLKKSLIVDAFAMKTLEVVYIMLLAVSVRVNSLHIHFLKNTWFNT